jgi:hypothetical protein
MTQSPRASALSLPAPRTERRNPPAATLPYLRVAGLAAAHLQVVGVALEPFRQSVDFLSPQMWLS